MSLLKSLLPCAAASLVLTLGPLASVASANFPSRARDPNVRRDPGARLRRVLERLSSDPEVQALRSRVEARLREVGRRVARQQIEMVLNNVAEADPRTGAVDVREDQDWGVAESFLSIFLAVAAERGPDGRIRLRPDFDVEDIEEQLRVYSGGGRRRARVAPGPRVPSGGSRPGAAPGPSRLPMRELPPELLQVRGEEVRRGFEMLLSNISRRDEGAGRRTLRPEQDWGVWEPGLRLLLALGVDEAGEGRVVLAPEVADVFDQVVERVGQRAVDRLRDRYLEDGDEAPRGGRAPERRDEPAPRREGRRAPRII
ncbi:MAG: hypothetical protein HY722_10115 [Planctomycetes bacterium]|nr:hypothetical protein [Planctomycetota bacterium]